ncbi:MAG: alkaline phosphatase family protein [Candidatus Eisenbacteria sp.]|nr:alkaline phosphatase family protein [Candidatus Eisenbacteria bacterium]
MGTGKRLAIIYLVDGARPDVLRELIAAGELPHIAREIASPGTFRTATSCLPSTTGPAHLPFLTGCFPGTLNIPGIRWLDKEVYRRSGVWNRLSFRSYNGIEALYMDRDLPVDRPTLFELTDRPRSIYSLITRGLRGGQNLTRASKLFLYLYAHLTDNWHPVDRLAHRRLLACLDDEPDFIFAVFPAVDSYSHLNHPRHDHTLAAYRHVDTSVGEIVAKLKRQGRWEETLFLITSDHGLTATDQHFDLARFLDRRGIRTLYYPVVWKRRPRAAVMISGNAVGKIYFLDNARGAGTSDDGGDDSGNSRGARSAGARGENGTDVDCSVARDGSATFLTGDAVPAALGSLWDELLGREEIDFLAWRAGGRSGASEPDGAEQGVSRRDWEERSASGRDGAEQGASRRDRTTRARSWRISIAAARGRAEVECSPEGLRYCPLEGDPFGLGVIDRPLDRQAALEATVDSDYPDALVQLEQFFGSPRSGDLLVVSRNGYDLRQAFEWPEHHSSHGSLHREHMMVPLIYNQTGWDDRAARTVDVFNTVLKWLGKPEVGNADGRALL